MNQARGSKAVERAAHAYARQVIADALEPRRMFALLGVSVTPPSFFYVDTAAVKYTAPPSVPNQGAFDVTADGGITFTSDSGTVLPVLLSPGDGLKLHAIINATANATTNGTLFNGGAGSSVTLSGGIDLNNNHTIDSNEPSGTLLSGQVTAFGFRDGPTGSTTDNFDFRVNPTGGALAGQFGDSVGITLTSENSNFVNTTSINGFARNFTGDAKGNVGAIRRVIGDYIWNDDNADGVQDATEVGIDGITVNLLDSTGITILKSTTTAYNPVTNTDGYYLFDNLATGTYYVQVLKPSTYDFTEPGQGTNPAKDSNFDPTLGRATVVLTSTSPSTDPTIDGGLIETIPRNPPTASLGDFVWEDLDGDGQQDAGEPGIFNVTAKLMQPGSDGFAGTSDDVDTGRTTTTDVNGAYSFGSLAAGDYFVQFTAPSGYVFTPQDQGADSSDSDASAIGNTGVITLADQQANNTIDAGLYRPAAIGDYAWVDSNGNGQQDAGEPPLAGVSVSYSGTTGAGVVVSGSGSTDSAGAYAFTDLAPGSYTVTFSAPSGGYLLTRSDIGADGTDSDPSPADASSGTTVSYTLASNQLNNTIDAGFYQPVSIGDFVWEDSNANGLQDSGETGISGVTVNLLDASGNAISGKTTTTNASGAYSFGNLTPSTYGVQFVAPANYYFSSANAGADDSADSDADTSTGKTGNYTLASGDSNTTVDAGLYRLASLGDYAWVDANGNGQQDNGESPLANVKVSLSGTTGGGSSVSQSTTTNGSGVYSFGNLIPGSYTVIFTAPTGSSYVLTSANVGADATDSDPTPAAASSGSTGSYSLVSGQANNTVDAGFYLPATIGDLVWEDRNGNGLQDAGEPGINGVTVNLLDASGNPISGKTTTTNASGLYCFGNLTPGTYGVQIVSPAGYVFTLRDVGANDAIDSDANTSTGKTGCYTVASGGTNNTVDAGLYVPASIGDFVWEDLKFDGIQQSQEPGIAGVTVYLLNASGTQMASTTTNSSGYYNFSNLVPGTYAVQFVAPSDFKFTTQDQGGNDSLDSDANVTTGKTANYTLFSRNVITTIDAGLVGKLHGLTGTIGFWANKNGQDLIRALGGSATSTALGSWLATTFPNIYGGKSSNPNYFSGKSNDYIANRYVALFNVSGQKLDCQVLATCLAMYVTTNQTNTNATARSLATSHGFILSDSTASNNLRQQIWDLGSNGLPFTTVATPSSIPTSMKVIDLLTATNANAVNGVLWASTKKFGSVTYSSTALGNMANIVFSDINVSGDILSWM